MIMMETITINDTPNNSNRMNRRYRIETITRKQQLNMKHGGRILITETFTAITMKIVIMTVVVVVHMTMIVVNDNDSGK